MDHIKILRILDFIIAGIALLLGLLLAAGLLISSGGILLGGDSGALMALVPTAIVYLVLLAVAGFQVVMALTAALRIGAGGGRIPQTIVAVMSLGSIPFGTIYGLYALWICWVNEETKSHFS